MPNTDYSLIKKALFYKGRIVNDQLGEKSFDISNISKTIKVNQEVGGGKGQRGEVLDVSEKEKGSFVYIF